MDFLGLKYDILQNIFLTAWAFLARHLPNPLCEFFSYSFQLPTVFSRLSSSTYKFRPASPFSGCKPFCYNIFPILSSGGFQEWFHFSLLYLEDSKNPKTAMIILGQYFMGYFDQLPHSSVDHILEPERSHSGQRFPISEVWASGALESSHFAHLDATSLPPILRRH